MNDDQNLQLIITFTILIGLLAFAITFYNYQQKTVALVRPENRRINPWEVWLQLIPLYNIVWQFFVVRRIAASIENELNSPVDDSILGIESKIYQLPTYTPGLLTCIFICIGYIPFPLLQVLAFCASMVTWIVYWVQLAKYRGKLKQRALLYTSWIWLNRIPRLLSSLAISFTISFALPNCAMLSNVEMFELFVNEKYVL